MLAKKDKRRRRGGRWENLSISRHEFVMFSSSSEDNRILRITTIAALQASFAYGLSSKH